MHTVQYSDYDIATLEHTPKEFIDIVIHTKYESREDYIKAISEFILDQWSDGVKVHVCLDYLELAGDGYIKTDIIIYIWNKINKRQVELLWLDKDCTSDLPF